MRSPVIFLRSSSLKPQPIKNTFRQSRSFVSLPLQTLTASRILPYPSAALFAIIADIPSYPAFLPYCTSSAITSSSAPDSTYHKSWPRTANLNVGWGSYTETFTSRVYCAPYHILEACAGDALPTIPQDQLKHYQNGVSDRPPETNGRQENKIFQTLLTRWTLSEFPFKPLPPSGKSPQEGNANEANSHPRTEANLVIEFRFASAVYAALSQAVAPKVAGMMIEAFEKRVGQVLGKGHGVEEEGGEGENRGRKTAFEGVLGAGAERAG